MAMGWKAGRCQHVQVSDLFSRDECDQAVMDFLAATEVRKFPPKSIKGGMQQAQRLIQVQGAVAAGRDLCVFLSVPFFSILFWSVFKLSFVSRDEA